MELFPKTCYKLSTTIRDNGFRYTMQTDDSIDIDFGIFLGPIFSMHQNKMSGLCESVDNNPNGIMMLRGIG